MNILVQYKGISDSTKQRIVSYITSFSYTSEEREKADGKTDSRINRKKCHCAFVHKNTACDPYIPPVSRAKDLTLNDLH
jgi:hypothetical protein